ncbi:endoglucanase 13 [Dioscorea cayenensis subsp. rotundata]|uniref:cellulase n=1 Tax=Dioscorea cayennensis subsp. rotundata TaxID=55577 RepID=A0AB40CFH4_DIOCR|nr:endoglucanase 13 [Dioscorea cayenensis subsp. rotundata]
MASFILKLTVLSLCMLMVTGFDYKDALDKSLLFFEAQRSGKLPDNQRVRWRGDSGLSDGFAQGVDLVGGYYDAGDHVKFGLPMAYSVTMLSWSIIEFEKEITDVNQLEHALDAIKWGTDYFIKAHKQPNTLWAQVGDGDSDHYCWERSEDMSTPRTAYKVDAEHPGSDIAGETAAALAAASIAFKPYDSSYSQLLLVHAKQLFYFANTFRGKYDESIPNARAYYPSGNGYYDELLWSAAWLFEATNDQFYLNYVIENSALMGGTGWAVTEFSWDNKYAGLQVLLSKVLLSGGNEAHQAILKQYQAKAEFFLCACLQKNNGHNVPMTPGGLLFVDGWNNMQYVSSASFLLAVYSNYLSMANAKLYCPAGETQPFELLTFAQSQADYILGKNPKAMSYMVGYQDKYPAHVHHRGASIPSVSILKSPIGCLEGFELWYNRQEANPNIIAGALVGGPNQKDEFYDQRNNYEQTEPAIAGTAPLVGLFARLSSLSGGSGYVPRNSSPKQSRQSAYVPRDSSPKRIEQNENPVEILHSITKVWKHNGVDYYRHKVNIKNTCGKPITELKLAMENLSGPIWGLLPTLEKNVYELPSWIKVLNPGSQFTFVYVQEGPQAKVSVLSYH